MDNEDHSVFIKAASVCESPVFYKYFDYGNFHKLHSIQGLLSLWFYPDWSNRFRWHIVRSVMELDRGFY